MKTVETPDWMFRLWHEIRDAVKDLGGWADEYSHGYIKDAESDVAHDGPPDGFPVWDGMAEADWPDWPTKDQDPDSRVYAQGRRVGDTHDGDWAAGTPYYEYHIGTFAIFRASHDMLAAMAGVGGYDPGDVSDNERMLDDGDHVVVVYML